MLLGWSRAGSSANLPLVSPSVAGDATPPRPDAPALRACGRWCAFPMVPNGVGRSARTATGVNQRKASDQVELSFDPSRAKTNGVCLAVPLRISWMQEKDLMSVRDSARPTQPGRRDVGVQPGTRQGRSPIWRGIRSLVAGRGGGSVAHVPRFGSFPPMARLAPGGVTSAVLPDRGTDGLACDLREVVAKGRAALAAGHAAGQGS